MALFQMEKAFEQCYTVQKLYIEEGFDYDAAMMGNLLFCKYNFLKVYELKFKFNMAKVVWHMMRFKQVINRPEKIWHTGQS